MGRSYGPASNATRTIITSASRVSILRRIPGLAGSHAMSRSKAKIWPWRFIIVPSVASGPASRRRPGARAVHVVGGRRGEEDGGAADVAGSPQRPAGMRPGSARAAVGVGAQGLGVVGREIAGRDRVDVDALAPPIRWRAALVRPATPLLATRCRTGRGCRPGRTAARRC